MSTGLMSTQMWRCPECGGASTDDAWNQAWWERRSRLTSDPDVRAEAVAEVGRGDAFLNKVYDIVNGRMTDTMVCPRCRYEMRDGNDEEGPEDLLGDIDPATIRPRP